MVNDLADLLQDVLEPDPWAKQAVKGTKAAIANKKITPLKTKHTACTARFMIQILR
jgi:hypothetical protein